MDAGRDGSAAPFDSGVVAPMADSGVDAPMVAPGAVGAPCMRNGDCTGGLCLANGHCSRPCDAATSDCPAGWTCAPLLGAGDLCQCTVGAETCNGLDDDCDGLVDNGAPCGGHEVCTAGTCVCPPEGHVCGGTCVLDFASDALNCGSCGNRCPPGGDCVGAICSCPGVMGRDCSGTCRDLAADPSNCGSCGNPCAAGGTCTAAICGCPGVMGRDCSGTCRDVASDTTSCGMCGHSCAVACGAGACVDVAELSAGSNHTCARLTDGTVRCWGANFWGQLGDGTTTIRSAPSTPVSGLTDAVEISSGGDPYGPYAHTCARRSSGAVVCWGSNGAGQLGDGTTADRLAPVSVSGVTDAVEISTGYGHTCARRSSGAVVCWGANGAGQVGDGTAIADRLTPVTVSGLAGAVEIALGGAHSCARLADGTVVCWGSNFAGVLGDGTATDRYTPVPVSGLTDAVEISCGDLHTCARRSSGAVVCWGYNLNGQLGDGTETNRAAPTPVSGLGDAVELSAGDAHTCARRSSGAVSCWGAGGLVGDGTETWRLTPTPVTGLTDAIELSAGWGHTCARRSSGGVVCWGHGDVGELGDGTRSRIGLTPVSVIW